MLTFLSVRLSLCDIVAKRIHISSKHFSAFGSIVVSSAQPALQNYDSIPYGVGQTSVLILKRKRYETNPWLRWIIGWENSWLLCLKFVKFANF